MFNEDGDDKIENISVDEQQNGFYRKSVNSGKSIKKPSPLKLGNFIQWACWSMDIPVNLTITKVYQERIKLTSRRKSDRRSIVSTKSAKSNLSTFSSSPTINETHGSLDIKDVKTHELSNIFITAEYDRKENLVGITINKNLESIPKELIRILGHCIPFHALFTKFTIRQGGLNHEIIHRIGKLLACTQITELCLDDSYVPELNFYSLLEQTSNLKYLSLCRCKINDIACLEIAKRLESEEPASEHLAILDLTSNNITDEGARTIGHMLRSNRQLVHLNLSSNKITDDGAICILDALAEFLFTFTEMKNIKRKRLEYYKQKFEMGITNPFECPAEPSPKCLFDERRTKNRMADFDHYFDYDKILTKDGFTYSIGNLKLMSLNFAYNNLGLLSLTKLVNVLKYQSNYKSGLMRVVLNGNRLPSTCSEFNLIKTLLRK